MVLQIYEETSRGLINGDFTHEQVMQPEPHMLGAVWTLEWILI
jgi:hypothetical protein